MGFPISNGVQLIFALRSPRQATDLSAALNTALGEAQALRQKCSQAEATVEVLTNDLQIQRIQNRELQQQACFLFADLFLILLICVIFLNVHNRREQRRA